MRRAWCWYDGAGMMVLAGRLIADSDKVLIKNLTLEAVTGAAAYHIKYTGYTDGMHGICN